MDSNQRRELQNMREQCGRMTRDYKDLLEGIGPGISLLFRSFLALAFFASAIIFPMISENNIPSGLREIPEQVAVNYTAEDVAVFMNDLKY